MIAEHAHRFTHTSPRIRGVALLGLLAVAILVTVAIRSEEPAGVLHHDPRLDVSARIPKGWHTQTFDNDVGLATHTGFVVSSVAHTFGYPDLRGGKSTSEWDMTDLPPHAVVVEISRVVRLPVACNSEEGNMSVTDLPLSLDDFDVIRTGRRYGSPPRQFIGVCLDNGRHFGVNAWFFLDASHSDRALAAELITSIERAS
jgi:hypothetical protein